MFRCCFGHVYMLGLHVLLLFRSCIHVRATCFAFVSVYTIFRLDFRNAPTMWYCFIIFFYLSILNTATCCTRLMPDLQFQQLLSVFIFLFIYFLFVQWVKVRGDCSFCWYWWICWPSLFNLSFHNTTLFYTSSVSLELLISSQVRAGL